MQGKFIRLEVTRQVAVVTIDNPPVNALHPDVSDELLSALDEALNDPRVRALILTGVGKAFVAGADIPHFLTLDRLRAERYSLQIQHMQERLQAAHFPIIAAINGFALGGGCELAMACDIRLAADSARLGQPEVGLGIIPGAGGTQALPRLVPVGTAKKLLFTGEHLSAAEALRLGLVDEVLPAAELLTRAHALAERIAANAPLAVRMAKKAVNLGLQTTLGEGLRLEAALFGELFESADVKEGVAAFMEKRKPVFEGR